MSFKKILSLLVAVSVAAALLSGCGFSPKVIGDISDPGECIEGFFDDLCNCRYDELDKYLYGQRINISKASDNDDFNSVLLRQLQASYSYEILESRRESGLNGYCKVEFTFLDPSLTEEDLRSHADVIAAAFLNSQDPAYTTDNNGICELNDDGAKRSAALALKELFETPEKYYVSHTYDINLRYVNRSWRILLEDDLLKAISGYYFVD